MVNKKDIIIKFINKIKVLKKNKLINIYNNLLQFKKGGMIKAKSRLTPVKKGTQQIIPQQQFIPQREQFIPQRQQFIPQREQFIPQRQQFIPPPQQQQIKNPNEKCFVRTIDYITDYINYKDKRLKAPRNFNLKLNIQTSIDAKRFYDIILKILTENQKILSNHRYLCTNLNILSTTDNFYLSKVLLFLENYFIKEKFVKYTMDKKKRLIFINYNNEDYIIKYRYDIETNSIDIKMGKKLDNSASLSRSRSSPNEYIKQRSTSTSSLRSESVKSQQNSANGNIKSSSSLKFGDRNSNSN
jgi:hypothetical protein